MIGITTKQLIYLVTKESLEHLVVRTIIQLANFPIAELMFQTPTKLTELLVRKNNIILLSLYQLFNLTNYLNIYIYIYIYIHILYIYKKVNHKIYYNIIIVG